MLTCVGVCACVCACHGTGRQWAQVQESVRTGREVERAGWEVDRDDEEEGEEMGFLSMMDTPISQSALGSSKIWCRGWRHLGVKKSLQSHKGLISCTD